MSSAILETWQVASFKGVPFLFQGHTEQGGRKSVVFDYPNQDSRYVQDLGLQPRIFKMTGIVSSQDVSTYYTNRSNLIKALSSSDSGTLVHPLEGTIQAFAKPFTLTEDIENVGVARFEMEFYETGEALYPTTESSFSSNVENALDNFVNSINQDFAKFWAVTYGYLNNFEYSKNLLENLANNFANLPSQVSNLSNAYVNFAESLADFNTNINTNTTNASNLSTSINSLFDTAGAMPEQVSDRYSIMTNFFSYSPDDPITQTTLGLQEREKNRLMLSQLINAQALCYAYVFTTQLTFSNQDDIESQSSVLDTQFKSIISQNIYQDIQGNFSEAISFETLSTLESMRYQTHDYLRSQSAAQNNVVTINVPRNSLLSLVYQYYGNIDLKNTIFNLNDLGSPIDIKGTFDILTTST